MSKSIFTKNNNMKIIMALLTSASLVVLSFQACSNTMSGVGSSSGASTAASTSTGTGGTGTGAVTASSIVAGQGSTVPGTGTLSCPTANSIVGKVTAALGTSIATGNCGKAYTQLSAQLPQTSDCTQSSGNDTAQLFIYACCTDVAARTASTKYGINLAGTVASNQTALIAAGKTILDAYTGGLGSASAATPGINTALMTMLTGANAPSTSTIAFIDVCVAASTSGALFISN